MPERLSMPAVTRRVAMPNLVVRTFGDAHVTMTLARPEVHNALDMPLVTALTETLTQLPSTVRTVLLEGAGASFCAGADLRSWQASSDPEPVAADAIGRLFLSMRRAPQIIVAKVHGVAAAGGAGLVAASDVVVASDDARFHFPEVRLGLVPAVISAYVQRAVGAARARYLFLTADTLDATQAHAAGLVQRLVPAAQLEAATLQVLHALWRGGPRALAESKWLLDAIDGLEPGRRADVCAQTLERVRSGAEAKEGIRAFFAREKPAWAQA